VPGRLTAQSSPPSATWQLRPFKKMADSDLNPVRYLATSTGAGEPDVLRYFILVASIILDPAAVLLLLAATNDNKLSGTVRCVLAPVHIVAVSNGNGL
jgi:hypothetical protein